MPPIIILSQTEDGLYRLQEVGVAGFVLHTSLPQVMKDLHGHFESPRKPAPVSVVELCWQAYRRAKMTHPADFETIRFHPETAKQLALELQARYALPHEASKWEWAQDNAISVNAFIFE